MCRRIVIGLLWVTVLFGCKTAHKKDGKPNIVIVFTDDQGYADVGVFGAKGFATPHLDQMAQEGMKFTDFYVASSVCSPSRAALLTGCYPQRIGIPNVLFPERENTPWDPKDRKSKTGIHKDETTLAEMLQAQGYATACFGKWHLGHHRPFMPLQQGFDEYFGLPYSNDMRPGKKPGKTPYPKLPLIKDNAIFKYMEDDQSTLTTAYTEKAVDFIHRNQDRPFFMYVAHSMPHIPLYVSDKFKGHSEKGIYGDVIAELDWSVGQINKTLKALGLEENTLVIFTSDNGPWLVFGDHGGSSEPLREGKFTTFEGGQRVPCIMKWPAQIPQGTECNEIATTLDILPTMAHITGAPLPEKKIDGHNIFDLMSAKANVKSPTDAFFYYRGWNLEAVRSGKWKLHVPHPYNKIIKDEDGNVHGRKKIPSEIELSLFDLSMDMGERNNVAKDNPQMVAVLLDKIEEMKQDLGDDEFSGNGKRPCGFVTEQTE